MGENPSRIDRQLATNREDIAATLDAIAYKINVPARIAAASPAILSDAVSLVDSVSTKIGDASRAATSGGTARAATFRLQRAWPLAVAYFIGMLIGLTWPKKGLV